MSPAQFRCGGARRISTLVAFLVACFSIFKMLEYVGSPDMGSKEGKGNVVRMSSLLVAATIVMVFC